MKKIKSQKAKIAIISLVIIAIVAASISLIYALFVKNSVDVKNDFTPAVSINPTVVEDDFDGVTKTNVKINVGDTKYPVFVRAAIVITWKDKDGIVYYKKPLTAPDGSDYKIELNQFKLENNSNGWVFEDGFYYYVNNEGKLQKVETNQETDILIISCQQTNFDDVPDGYSLSVEIIPQTVQAYGTTDDLPPDEKPAYKDAWGDKTPDYSLDN